LNDYQDCNNDPRDGCEDTSRWCLASTYAQQYGKYTTQSDSCSIAQSYYCDTNGFDSYESPCTSSVTGLFLSFPAAPNKAYDCWFLTNLQKGGQGLNIDHTIEPYCDRDVTHIDTRGECIFNCNAGYADCDGNPSNGCEQAINQTQYCSTDCVNCMLLSGIDRTTTPPTCIPDPLNAGDFRCNFSCPGGSITSCADVDGDWETGCEVARNGDFDKENVFMNQGAAMDCAIMEAEAVKNPDMFRHHLHIDLTVEIPTTLTSAGNQFLPPGSIVCQNQLVAHSFNIPDGRCAFMCITGFANGDPLSYNGCESASLSTSYPYIYGGFWMGDPIIESFFSFLCTAYTDSTISIQFPINVCDFNTRYSEEWSTIPMWY